MEVTEMTAHSVLSGYWKRAGHCCDPDETVTEMITVLGDAGFVIVPKDFSDTVADMRGYVATWDVTSGYSPLIERIREWIAELETAAKPEPCIHPGVFATGPVPGTEHCGTCNTEVSRTEL